MLARYARHHLIDWWDQEKLLQSRVLIAGAGALGNEVAKNLALVGVGQFTIVDFDTIELSNLARAVFFRDDDIGKPKAKQLAERCQELNPDMKIEWIHGDVELDLGSWFYRKFDVVLGCLDSIDARLAINSRCMQAGIPWINGGMGAVAGEVACFTPSSPCFQCTMSPDMWKRRNQRFSCGWLRSSLPEKKVATTATISSLVGAIMSNEALLFLHEGPNKHSGLRPGNRLFIQVKPYNFSVAELSQDPNCTAHDKLGDSPEKIGSLSTPESLIAGTDSYIELNIDLLEGLSCPSCGKSQKVLAPAKRFDVSLLRCPTCGAERKANIFNVIDASVKGILATPFSDFSLPKQHLISLRTDLGRKYFVISDE